MAAVSESSRTLDVGALLPDGRHLIGGEWVAARAAEEPPLRELGENHWAACHFPVTEEAPAATTRAAPGTGLALSARGPSGKEESQP